MPATSAPAMSAHARQIALARGFAVPSIVDANALPTPPELATGGDADSREEETL